jgi:hypothetical protein
MTVRRALKKKIPDSGADIEGVRVLGYPGRKYRKPFLFLSLHRQIVQRPGDILHLPEKSFSVVFLR